MNKYGFAEGYRWEIPWSIINSAWTESGLRPYPSGQIRGDVGKKEASASVTGLDAQPGRAVRSLPYPLEHDSESESLCPVH